MLRLLLQLFILDIFLNSIEIIKPKSLRDLVVSVTNEIGVLSAATSAFGEVPYDQLNLVQILSPPPENEAGCLPLTPSTSQTVQGNFVWLLKRGDCTFAKKAFNGQQSGAFAVIVYNQFSDEDVTSVVPVADSTC